MKDDIKKIIINLDFSKFRMYNPKLGEIGNMIIKELNKKKAKISRLRYTYCEGKYGIAEMPRDLILASFINDYYNGFSWYLDKLSGKYKFEFRR